MTQNSSSPQSCCGITSHGAATVNLLRSLCLGLAILLSATTTATANTDFASWLVELRAEARGIGISDATLDAALNDITLNERVIELDRNQPEFNLTFDEYLARFVTDWRRQTGARMLAEHAAILDEIEKKYGVQKRFLITFWGMETSFGRYLGSFNVPRSLVTLAYDGRRSAYFRKELLNALRIIEEGHITASEMNGSWAGAMGQSQFMPSSFVNYAQDWNGDGRRDIWGTKADVFASAANYLKKAGWRDDITWGRQVRIPGDLVVGGMGATKLSEAKTWMPLPQWQAAGIRNVDGADLPTRPLQARLVMPDGVGGPAYLVYKNYESILRWNRSNYYALAIGHLSDTLR